MNDENIIPDEVVPQDEPASNKLVKKNNIIIYVAIGLVMLGALYFLFQSKQDKTSVVATITPTTTTTTQSAELKLISLSEISTHNSKDSCWTTINDGVYDVTKFISMHKGGDKILNACGVDATDFFTGKSPIGRVHSAIAQKLLEGMKIGDLQK